MEKDIFLGESNDFADTNDNNLGDLGDMSSWCSEHPILTFLLAGSAITAVVNIVTSIVKKK